MSEQINISQSNIEGRCDLKCSYNFTYKDDSSTAYNYGTSIFIKPQQTGEALITFNKKKYRVYGTLLTRPSIHLYNSKLADAEICIIHSPENGGKELRVFIPIKSSNQTTSGSDEITEVINDVATSAPAQNDNVNIGSFNLQKIVPNKPFINYSNQQHDCIVFIMLDAIPISSFTLDTLKEIIQPTTDVATGTGSLFLNSSGPNTTKELGDGIYISCNPTGVSEETEEVTYEKEDSSFNIEDIKNDPTFILIMQGLFASLVFILVCFIWNYGFKFIDGEYADAAMKASQNSKPT